jgi:diguanylate cyclase (GGDEF)-like protein
METTGMALWLLGESLGDSMFFGRKIGWYFYRLRFLLAALGLLGCFALATWLRELTFTSDSVLFYYIQIVGSLLSLTYAAHAVVRFRGTHDRLNLTLGFGFALSGLISTIGMFEFYGRIAVGSEQSTAPMFWMVGRTLLALVILAALVVERRVSRTRDPGGEVAIALGVVCMMAYLTGATYFSTPIEPAIYPAAWLARPWELIPGVLFLAGAIGFGRRLPVASSAFDRALCAALWVNVACHVVMTQSAHIFDAPFTAAQALRTASCAIVLGGTVLDNARLFDQVRQMAVSDSLTGLGNYRRLLHVLQSEIQRSQRSGRPFAVLLMDLDSLKKINDRHGHLVGSRALCRLGRVLRLNCRGMDTAARYGGDEFALVLPEAGADVARLVSERICDRLASDGEEPRLSVSVGTAVFPADGRTIEELLSAADRALYGMKRGQSEVRSFTRIAACL